MDLIHLPGEIIHLNGLKSGSLLEVLAGFSCGFLFLLKSCLRLVRQIFPFCPNYNSSVFNKYRIPRFCGTGVICIHFESISHFPPQTRIWRMVLYIRHLFESVGYNIGLMWGCFASGYELREEALKGQL